MTISAFLLLFCFLLQQPSNNRGLVFALSTPADRSKLSGSSANNMTGDDSNDSNSNHPNINNVVNVAHLGNSIQYYNDLPRFLQNMIVSSRYSDMYYQNSCLRGGATLASLWEKGNGMRTKFGGPENDIGAATVTELLSSSLYADNDNQSAWNYIILNDHTQSPARESKRNASLLALKEHYMPLFPTQATVIFIQTAAYKYPAIHDSEGLGDFDTFTNLVWDGLQHYIELLPNSKIAPVGDAFRLVQKQDETLWAKLYARDDFHPSPHGTYLEACVLFCTMFSKRPPIYNQNWWHTARYMQPPDLEPLPLPTDDEANVLRSIACQISGIDSSSADDENIEDCLSSATKGEVENKITNKKKENGEEGTSSRL